MSSFDSVRVAVVQATPVILDAEATVDLVVKRAHEAASDGARLVVFPEAFVSLYPTNSWAQHLATWSGAGDELWERLWESSVDVGGPHVARIREACAGLGVHVAIGVNEREDARPGTLYDTLLVIGPDGLVLRHRKLMPTMQERVVYGVGAGDDMDVAALPGVGRVGGLICWENRMPLARWQVYRGGPQIWIALTADDSDGWLASVRHIAIESGTFLVNAPQYIPTSAFPPDFPFELPADECIGRGGACIISPDGEVIAGPLYDGEGVLVADCDLRATLRAKRYFDVVGHYGRADVLAPGARPAAAPPVTEG